MPLGLKQKNKEFGVKVTTNNKKRLKLKILGVLKLPNGFCFDKNWLKNLENFSSLRKKYLL